MHLRFDKKEFLKALQLGGSFAGKSKSIPIYDYVKIEVRDSNVYITSTDGENEICAKSHLVSADETGVFCVMYSVLVNYIKQIPSIEFEMIVSGDDCTVKHPKGKFSFAPASATEFPVMKTDDDSTEVLVDRGTFSNFILKAKDFVANDELRPVMNGIYMFIKDGSFGCASSDSHSLYTDSVDYTDDRTNVDFIMNQRAFMPIVNLCDTSYGDIKIKIGDRNIICRGDICRITFRRIEGKYPNFNVVIPKSYTIQSDISKAEFLSSLSRAKLSANKATQLIKLQFTPLSLDICASDLDFSMSGMESITASTNGEIAIGVKADNIERCLRSTDTDSFLMQMTDATRAIVIKNTVEDKKTILIMPMMLNN